MKKIITIIVFASFLASVSAQLEVNSSGDTYVYKNIYLGSTTSNLISATNNVPIIFKVNSFFAGCTGYPGNSNVSFGFGSLPNPLTVGDHNTAVGREALRGITTGFDNTAIGSFALYSDTEGHQNIAIGHNALYNNLT
ncbi:MAG: hypothetical protein FWD60_07735, partial [Candidatus Azobacteroides sp.]|nr:hypothetical protein [Candidatus Azobacteroides sp.]